MIETSVIIPTFNKAEYLDLTLAAYTQQTYKDFELVIIDNGSSDHTSDIINKYKKTLSINCERLNENHRHGVVRNIGIELAQGKYIINVDDDRIPVPEFIAAHVNYLREHPDNISVGSKHSVLSVYKPNLKINQNDMVEFLKRSPRSLESLSIMKPLFTPDDIMNDCSRVLKEYYLFEGRDNFPLVRQRYGDELNGFYFKWIMATCGNTAFRKGIASHVQFDDSYSGWGCDDIDFAYQLFLRGHDFAFLKAAANYHQEHPRRTNEWGELKKTLKYFCHKFNTIDTFIWAKTFKDAKQFDHAAANSLYVDIQQSNMSNESRKHLMILFNNDLNLWWQ